MAMVPIDKLLADARTGSQIEERPLVTLSYAQSLDGSIAARRGSPLSLSSPEAMALTHRLRAAHETILVGIGTVLADNPRLTVRLVEGRSPQPIILDSHLRLPLQANLLHNPDRAPWIATTEEAAPERELALEAHGAKIIRFPPNSQGCVPLPALLAHLADQGVKNLMVEGGASVITNFLSQRLVDILFLTIAPVLVGGLRAPENNIEPPLRLLDFGFKSAGDDLLIWGKPSQPSVTPA
jgi:3,4-dihydroxy 2-butanone 4-phosphate synthase/GTP cyclohydrolase II